MKYNAYQGLIFESLNIMRNGHRNTYIHIIYTEY